MAVALQFVLNGRIVRIENFSPNTTLLEFLRGAGLTGAKEGCAEGDCGACSVVMVDRDAQGRPCYRAINSCLVPLCLMAGREIVSVEGVASGQGLHPVQRKMAECHGSQCGYCTPGFIMSLFEGYYRDDIHQHDELDDQLSGNLCRCTGYRPIRDAAIEAFSIRSSRRKSAQNKTQNQSEQTDVCCYEDTFAARLKKAGAGPDGVEYEFENEKFFRPTSLARLLNLLQQFPDGRLVAGATELGLDITKRYKKFPTLISVEAVPELREIKSTETEWHIGAAVTLTQIEEKMAEEFPALGDMLRVFGSRQIRNRATMGGNLVTASPIGDSAPVLLALDAKVVLVGQASSLSPSKTGKLETGATPVLHFTTRFTASRKTTSAARRMASAWTRTRR
jgi:xanthine dehydrogenase small subunit